MKHQNVFFRNQMTTSFLLMFLTLEIFIFAPLVFGQQASFVILNLNKPVKRTISPGEIHGYQIKVEKDQFAHLKIESPYIQLIETAAHPDSQNLKYVRFDFPNGFSIKLIAEKSDLFRVQLKADSLAKKGKYVIVLEELRTTTAKDKTELNAKMLYDAAFALESKGGAESLQIAKQKYSEALILWQNIENYEMTIATLHQLGETCFKVSDYQGMKLYYYQALRDSRERKDVVGEATALQKIAVARWSTNEAFEALDNLDNALQLSQQLKDRKLEADILDTYGLIYTELDDYEKGAEYAQRSLAIRKTLGNEELIANSLQSLAEVYHFLGENQKALDYYHQALGIFRKFKLRYSEAMALGQIGFIYYKFGNYETALDYYQQCMDISKEIGNRLGEAWALKIMGNVYSKMGKYQLSLRNYKTSLNICREMGVRTGVGANLTSLAEAYIAMDSTNKALELLNEALVIKREINDSEGGALVLISIGDLYTAVGDIDKAIDYHKQALVLAKTIQDPRLHQRTYYALGKKERQAGRIADSREHIEKSIQIADSLRRSVLSQNMRASYFASIQSCFEELLLIFMQQHRQNPENGYDRMALQISERSRGQSMLEMLNESQVDLRSELDPALLERERRLRQELNAKAQQRQRLMRGELDADRMKSLEAEIRTLLTEHENLEARIRQQQPRLAAIEKAEALPVEKIQTEVLDDSTALIEYALIDERSFAWVVTSDQIKYFELPPAAEIDSTARFVYQSLSARNVSQQDESAAQRHARIQGSDKQLYEAMSDLSKKILPPLAGHLYKPRLVFVCDEILQYIPFGALTMPDNGSKKNNAYDPLVNHFEILSVPSASALPLIRQDKQRASRPDKLIAMFADPVFSADDPRLSLPVAAKKDSAEPIIYAHLDKALQETGVGTRSDLSRLPFSRREANDIIALTSSENCQCFMDFDANYLHAMSQDLSHFKIIHFATHGMMNNMHPELSGLVLSLYDQQGKSQNGFLRLHDIYQLDLNADLVVLSACQTALGKDIRGEGLIGLTRGFMYAGAPRVVASLWKVDDEATAELMKRFYQFMLGEEQLPASAALRKAQISIMNEKRWQSPYYWAGFVLQGDWQ